MLSKYFSIWNSVIFLGVLAVVISASQLSPPGFMSASRGMVHCVPSHRNSMSAIALLTKELPGLTKVLSVVCFATDDTQAAAQRPRQQTRNCSRCQRSASHGVA